MRAQLNGGPKDLTCLTLDILSDELTFGDAVYRLNRTDDGSPVQYSGVYWYRFVWSQSDADPGLSARGEWQQRLRDHKGWE